MKQIKAIEVLSLFFYLSNIPQKTQYGRHTDRHTQTLTQEVRHKQRDTKNIDTNT
jgi:hypothetical protein